MLLAVEGFEVCFLEYTTQNGLESQERESQLVETT